MTHADPASFCCLIVQCMTTTLPACGRPWWCREAASSERRQATPVGCLLPMFSPRSCLLFVPFSCSQTQLFILLLPSLLSCLCRCLLAKFAPELNPGTVASHSTLFLCFPNSLNPNSPLALPNGRQASASCSSAQLLPACTALFFPPACHATHCYIILTNQAIITTAARSGKEPAS